jgi:hypothetical protein
MQLELFPWDLLTEREQADILQSIRRTYWHIRSVRKGRFGQAKLRRHYREVAVQKNACLWQASKSVMCWISYAAVAFSARHKSSRLVHANIVFPDN